MILFRKKSDENSLITMENKVVVAFSRVNQDMDKLRSWITHLHTKSQTLHNSHEEHASLTRRDIDKLNSWLMHLHSHNQSLHKYVKETAEKVIDMAHRNVEFHKRLELLEEQVKNHKNELELAQSSSSVRTKSVPSVELVSEPRPNLRTSRFEENIMNRIRPHRKNFIFDEIMKLIDENTYSTKEIEHKIVREKNLCGRTAFYSYLKELKLKGSVKGDELGAKRVLVNSPSIK